REGYFAIEPQSYSKLSAGLKALDLGQALDLDFPVSTALPFQAAVIAPAPRSGNDVVVNFAIDAHALSFELQNDGMQHASVDCGVHVYTPKGQSIDMRGNTSSAVLNAQNYALVRNRFFPCREAVHLPEGDYLLRLGVRDDRTGLIGSVNARVKV